VAAVRLRRATEADAALLLAWRNDPLTRANSRRQHALSWEELITPPPGAIRDTYIGESEGRAIGSIHLDRDSARCELSWTVAPAERGRGWGKALVAAAIAEARASAPAGGAIDVVAMIKPENHASQRIAESLGFLAEGEHQGLVLWRWRGSGEA
jgi:RimJ/RimL family protein N-acetyltransferase